MTCPTQHRCLRRPIATSCTFQLVSLLPHDAYKSNLPPLTTCASVTAASRHNQDAEERALRVLWLKVLHVTGLKDVICFLFLCSKTSFSYVIVYPTHYPVANGSSFAEQEQNVEDNNADGGKPI